MQLSETLYNYYDQKQATFTDAIFYVDAAGQEDGMLFRGMSLLRVMQTALAERAKGDDWEVLGTNNSFSKRRWIAEEFANAGRSSELYGYEEQKMYEDQDWALEHALPLPMKAGRLIVPGILLSAADDSELFTERLGNVVRNSKGMTIENFTSSSQSELRRIWEACTG